MFVAAAAFLTEGCVQLSDSPVGLESEASYVFGSLVCRWILLLSFPLLTFSTAHLLYKKNRPLRRFSLWAL